MLVSPFWQILATHAKYNCAIHFWTQPGQMLITNNVSIYGLSQNDLLVKKHKPLDNSSNTIVAFETYWSSCLLIFSMLLLCSSGGWLNY